MMWNFLVGVLLTDASIVLFDGNPGYPDLGTLWDLAGGHRDDLLRHERGVHRLVHEGGRVAAGGPRDLSALRAVGSTGSPLSPEGFRWVYDQLGADTWLFSTSGGTDVCTAFVGGVPTLPVYLGELQARSLGAAVEAWDEDGQSVVGRGRRARDHRADAVDADLLLGRRRRLALPRQLLLDVPRHLAPRRLDQDHLARDGDHLRPVGLDDQPRRRPDGHERDLPGRAVDRRGRRRARRRRAGGPGRQGWMPLFVVLREGASLDDELLATIRRRIREDCSPRHVPDEIRQIAEVPRTLSGKVLEVPVKRILTGTPVEQVASAGSRWRTRRRSTCSWSWRRRRGRPPPGRPPARALPPGPPWSPDGRGPRRGGRRPVNGASKGSGIGRGWGIRGKGSPGIRCPIGDLRPVGRRGRRA